MAFTHCIFLVILTFCVLSTLFAQGLEPVKLTIRTLKPFGGAAAGPHYECYISEPGLSRDSLEFRRLVNTRTSGLNPHPPVSGKRDHPTLNNVKQIYLDATNENAFGVFTCKASKSGQRDTTLVTIILREATVAYFHPEGFFTTSVSAGDSTTLSVRTIRSVSQQNVRWRRNSGGAYNNGLTTLSFNPVQSSNAAVYQTFTVNGRDEGLHSLQHLIVRACPDGLWGSTCTNLCDACYNGGICDDQSGICICAPGFMGKNCLTACGGNKFGFDCEFTCGDNEGACSGTPFCLPDPYGCSCATGFRSLDCRTNPSDDGGSAAYKRDTEKYYNPKIKKTTITRESKPNQLYAHGLHRYQHWDEINKIFLRFNHRTRNACGKSSEYMLNYMTF